jgi:hypothetical protein
MASLESHHAGDMAAVIHRPTRVAVVLGAALDVERVAAGHPIPHEGVIPSHLPMTTGSVAIQ